ncbi:MAG: DUF2620 family protein [Streptococcaceae bacterium]|jgi:hypothetical protein|nr:DUF2620 family protein [Streptococcaceae bacterium]
MKRIVVGGQMGKSEIENDLKELTAGKAVEITVKSDLDAALAVKNEQADIYFGACETGAGGALAMATALLGTQKAITVSSPTKVMSEEEIKKNIEDGKIAFGFTINTKNSVLPILVKYLFE